MTPELAATLNAHSEATDLNTNLPVVKAEESTQPCVPIATVQSTTHHHEGIGGSTSSSPVNEGMIRVNVFFNYCCKMFNNLFLMGHDA